MTESSSTTKLTAGNPHVAPSQCNDVTSWLDERDVVSATTLSAGGSLLCEFKHVVKDAGGWRRGARIRAASVVFALVACAAVESAAQSAALPVRRKACVYLGWDTLRAPVAEVYRRRGEFAATGIDGLVMNVNGLDARGKSFLARRVMASHPFSREQFNSVAPLLKEILRTRGLESSMLAVYWMGTKTRRIGWADDAAWAEFASNMRVVCALAKEVGFKGLFIDHEDYTGKPLFRWRANDDPPYATAVSLARQRGGETARAMSEGDSCVRFVFERSLMHLADAVRSQTPRETAALQGDLWYPFLNGFVEGMSSEMRIVEGCENAYGARSGVDYRARIGDCRAIALEMIEPELRAKYLAQSEMSFGKYLDGWMRGGLSVTNGVTESLFGAGAHCDTMFWLYGEKFSIVDWGRRLHPRAETTPWNVKFPGLASVLRVAVGDYDELRQTAASGAMANLVSNSGCDARGSDLVPTPFKVWMASGKPTAGMASHDAAIGCSAPGSIRLGAGSVCLTFRAGGIKEGDRIYASFAAKGDGVLGDVVWTKDGAWCWKKGYQLLAKPSMKLADGWQRYECAIIAPSDVDGVGFVLSARATADAPAWFDDISIYRW